MNEKKVLKGKWFERKLSGVFTIEASVIVPLILFVFSVLMFILFYYHDKNILLGTAHETAAMGSSRQAVGGEELEKYFASRIRGKLLLFTWVQSEVQVEEEEVFVICKARKNRMSLKVECTGIKTEPEDYIRGVRKLKKIGEGIGEKGEDILQE